LLNVECQGVLRHAVCFGLAATFQLC